MLNVVDCVKETSKTFEIIKLWAYSLVTLAYFLDVFSSPKTDKKTGTLSK